MRFVSPGFTPYFSITSHSRVWAEGGNQWCNLKKNSQVAVIKYFDIQTVCKADFFNFDLEMRAILNVEKASVYLVDMLWWVLCLPLPLMQPVLDTRSTSSPYPYFDTT